MTTVDGRLSRTVRSRLAICEACLDLVQEGTLQPSADEIAARAGVSRRSVFNHFADLAELYDAVVEVGMQRCEPLLEKISDDAPVHDRVKRLIEVRTKFLEATSSFARALTAQSLVGTAADQAIRVSRDALRINCQEIERLFQREIGDLPAQDHFEVVESLSAALSAVQWEYLRRSRQHSITRSRAIVARTLIAVLRDAGVDV
ncbi:MAG: TetR/AcrR family transcriptional regulator [Myxococcota bacterium]|nr:TetR/AcrR family transcriptional regulator [Myxococcota bacterium]